VSSALLAAQKRRSVSLGEAGASRPRRIESTMARAVFTNGDTTRRIFVAAAALLLPTRALCDTEPSPSPEPSPSRASPAPYFSAEEEVTPSYDATTGSSTTLNLRGLIPYVAAGVQYVVRMKLPIVTSAPETAITGSGDLSLFDLAVFDTQRGRWLAGATIRLPSAENDSLGSGKYSVGPAFGYQSTEGRWTFGFFNQDFFSVIGPKSRAPVGQTKIDLVVAYRLPRGWTIGTSSMSFTYDWTRNAWTDVPIGLQILHLLDASFESEKNLAGVPGVPNWTFRTSVKWTFPR
jgi:hypothetical protein